MTDKTLTKYDQFKITLRGDAVRERFETICKDKTDVVMSALLTVVNGNAALQNCSTGSILTSAIKAAILDLPVENTLGYAYIVPFGKEATFILGYKGYIQLALRTKAYKIINATPIYEGEQITENRLTGEIKLNGKRTGDEVIGFAAYFLMKDGFEKFKYMTIDAMHAHAKKYSKSYGNARSAWTTNFDDMGKKTVLRQLLSKYGLLSIQYQDEDMPLVSTDDNGRLTEMEDMVVPPFDDIVDAEMVDAETPTEPQPENKPDDNYDIFTAVYEAKLSTNVHAAKAALMNYCKTGYDTPEKAIAWMRLYRGWKDSDKTTQEAADLANDNETPK
jgi:recombination protein RecT